LTGKQNFTMMVVVPTDGFDNPKEDNTAVIIKDQFQEDITSEQKKHCQFHSLKTSILV
jgi:hypothetical protein